MSMGYIRKTYCVPAKRGGRVQFLGPCIHFYGTIVSARGGRLRVRSDDSGLIYTLHPSWNVKYIPDATK